MKRMIKSEINSLLISINKTADIFRKPEGRAQRLESNLYEYCALAQEICGFWDDFVGSYGSEGVFFGRHQVFKLRPF